MRSDQKQEIIRILENAKGDDLYRAQQAFKGLDLNQQHGASGKTRRQILWEYECYDAKIDELINSVKRS